MAMLERATLPVWNFEGFAAMCTLLRRRTGLKQLHLEIEATTERCCCSNCDVTLPSLNSRLYDFKREKVEVDAAMSELPNGLTSIRVHVKPCQRGKCLQYSRNFPDRRERDIDFEDAVGEGQWQGYQYAQLPQVEGHNAQESDSEAKRSLQRYRDRRRRWSGMGGQDGYGDLDGFA